MEDRGEWPSVMGVLKGELQMLSMGERPPGEKPPGDRRPIEFMLARLVAVRDPLDAKEPLRPVVEIEDMDPWGTTVRRGVGEDREAPSRRRRSSPVPGKPCASTSSTGGEDARRFWPRCRRPMPAISSMWKSASSAFS